MGKVITDDRIHEGHRKRMRAKLLAHGHNIFDTYELLEMLLYYVVPCKNTNPIAKRLFARFGSLDAILKADVRELMEVEGVGEKCAQLISAVGEIGNLRGAELGKVERILFSNYIVAGEYFADYFSAHDNYRVAVMLLDNSLRMLDTITVYENLDYESGKIVPNVVALPAIKMRASAVLTAHFHPNGPLFPTPGDRITNDAVSEAFGALGIVHLEHYVVCGEKYIGMMHHLKERFAACSEIYAFLESKERAVAEGGEFVDREVR